MEAIVSRVFPDTATGNAQENAWATKREAEGYRISGYERVSGFYEKPSRWRMTMALATS